METSDNRNSGSVVVSFVLSRVSLPGISEEESTVSSNVRLKSPSSTLRRNSRMRGGMLSPTNKVEST